MKHSIVSVIGAGLLGAAFGAIALTYEIVNREDVIERHVSLQAISSLEELVSMADLVVVGQYAAFDERSFIVEPMEGDEGYSPDDPSDIYASIDFSIEEVVHGVVNSGQDRISVDVWTAMGDDLEDRDVIWVVDNSLQPIQRSDGRLVSPAAFKSKKFVLLLDETSRVTESGSASYSLIGRGLAELREDGIVEFRPGLALAEPAEQSQDMRLLQEQEDVSNSVTVDDLRVASLAVVTDE